MNQRRWVTLPVAVDMMQNLPKLNSRTVSTFSHAQTVYINPFRRFLILRFFCSKVQADEMPEVTWLSWRGFPSYLMGDDSSQ